MGRGRGRREAKLMLLGEKGEEGRERERETKGQREKRDTI